MKLQLPKLGEIWADSNDIYRQKNFPTVIDSINTYREYISIDPCGSYALNIVYYWITKGGWRKQS